jgi:hypothetical protein
LGREGKGMKKKKKEGKAILFLFSNFGKRMTQSGARCYFSLALRHRVSGLKFSGSLQRLSRLRIDKFS